MEGQKQKKQKNVFITTTKYLLMSIHISAESLNYDSYLYKNILYYRNNTDGL